MVERSISCKILQKTTHAQKQQNNLRVFDPCWSLLPLIWTTCHCSSSTLSFLSRSCILSVTYRKQIKWTRTRSPQRLPPPPPCGWCCSLALQRSVEASAPTTVPAWHHYLHVQATGGHLWGPQSSHSQEKRKKISDELGKFPLWVRTRTSWQSRYVKGSGAVLHLWCWNGQFIWCHITRGRQNPQKNPELCCRFME